MLSYSLNKWFIFQLIEYIFYIYIYIPKQILQDRNFPMTYGAAQFISRGGGGFVFYWESDNFFVFIWKPDNFFLDNSKAR